MFYLLLIFNILNISLIIPTNVLLNVQIIWRHGDRPPTEIYQYDPNKNVWSVSLGQLTQKGMRQHYDLGKRFFKKYSQEKKLLNSNYDANQIYVRSTDIDRTLVSAYSNLAGFYAQSKNTYPNDDYLLNPNFKCERRSQLEDDRRNNPKFLDYQSTLSNLCEYLTKHSGIKVKGYTEIRNLYSNIRLEKRYYNLPQPSWVTQDIYNQMEIVVNKSINYIHGEEGFGLPDDIELIRLKGGNFAYTILQNIKNTINNNSDTKLYFAFSAHDDTLWAFATVLGFKKKVMGEGYVDYAASFTIELWKNESKNYYIKILYAGNAYDEFKTVTSFIKGCPQSDFCPIEIFENYLKPYIIEKPLNHC
ncbi:Histidine phosphatase superfamily, clade-2-containing protein [Strongyloides ratti]|uniref:Histidine phosphatase superfamily, clade-2-containing protein n=1 Tax=Strongyloides ratti TaxID=34506 RepID=A0A090LJW3_STRRB|nr:Histidine phosphatase superfamily, clade-2-containing protein [Strongyloides ratti]CEF70003.1 Histidine phosphatase superfamily, clade-2-containing protein [Strongyloides ratti]